MLLAAAAMGTAEQACAGDPAGQPPAVHGSQVMLYVSQPLWSRGESVRVYGLRMARLRTIESSERTTLIDFQLRSQSDFRVEFGRRLTWNVTRREFGGPPSIVGFQMLNRTSGFQDAVTQEPSDPTSLGFGAVVAIRPAVSGGQSLIDSFIHPSWPITRSWNASAETERLNWLVTGNVQARPTLDSRNVWHRTDYVAVTE